MSILHKHITFSVHVPRYRHCQLTTRWCRDKSQEIMAQCWRIITSLFLHFSCSIIVRLFAIPSLAYGSEWLLEPLVWFYPTNRHLYLFLDNQLGVSIKLPIFPASV
jgi:hypothetical protein